jgi:hypothetical protein
MATSNLFTAATDAFLLTANNWLSAEDAPAIAALMGAASALDKDGITPALLSAYGLTYRSLLKRKPGADAEPDELESLLSTETEGV